MPVPQNAKAIYSFLIAAGFSSNAAAGILGNIEQESGGDPAAGHNPPGSGLIQELGYPSTNSLMQNMQEIIAYVKRNGSIADINAHSSSPSAAALYFSQRYERPGIPNNANREQSANEVAAAAKSGNWPASGGTAQASTNQSGGGGVGFDFSAFIPFFKDATDFVNGLKWLITPSHWVRIAAFLVGVALLLFAIHAFLAVTRGEPVIDATGKIPIPVPL